MNIHGKEYKVLTYVEIIDDRNDENKVVGKLPILNIPMMSDFKWQVRCIENKLDNIEHFQKTENIAVSIFKLLKWCNDNIDKATEQELEYFERVKERLTLTPFGGKVAKAI